MDRGAWWAPWGHKASGMTEQLIYFHNFHILSCWVCSCSNLRRRRRAPDFNPGLNSIWDAWLEEPYPALPAVLRTAGLVGSAHFPEAARAIPCWKVLPWTELRPAVLLRPLLGFHPLWGGGGGGGWQGSVQNS